MEPLLNYNCVARFRRVEMDETQIPINIDVAELTSYWRRDSCSETSINVALGKKKRKCESLAVTVFAGFLEIS